ncbi:NUDIX hydrolase [Deinococcus sp.]|uniref:NUDIX hydrolase n=1 Tax=Deinococcus sp. TaxID=47478 RepID=UPI0025D6ED37|nr:NUDIX hydrolase [Deinococcus sp.]
MPVPHLQCAASLIFNTAGQVLLVRQNYGAHRWGAPGGSAEMGETPMDTACREAQEEIGVQIKLLQVVGVYLLRGGGWPDMLAHVFLARVLVGEPRIVDPSETLELAWTPLDRLPAEMTHDIGAALDDFRARRYGAVRVVERRHPMPPYPFQPS